MDVLVPRDLQIHSHDIGAERICQGHLSHPYCGWGKWGPEEKGEQFWPYVQIFEIKING